MSLRLRRLQIKVTERRSSFLYFRGAGPFYLKKHVRMTNVAEKQALAISERNI